MAVFWVVVLLSVEDVYQCFRGTCCLCHQGDEPLVNFYQTTQCYNPEDSHLHTCRRENLRSYCVNQYSADCQNLNIIAVFLQCTCKYITLLTFKFSLYSRYQLFHLRVAPVCIFGTVIAPIMKNMFSTQHECSTKQAVKGLNNKSHSM
jgi:hypothetical protein